MSDTTAPEPPHTLQIAPTIYEGHWFIVNPEAPPEWNKDGPWYVRKEAYESAVKQRSAFRKALRKERKLTESLQADNERLKAQVDEADQMLSTYDNFPLPDTVFETLRILQRSAPNDIAQEGG